MTLNTVNTWQVSLHVSVTKSLTVRLHVSVTKYSKYLTVSLQAGLRTLHEAGPELRRAISGNLEVGARCTVHTVRFTVHAVLVCTVLYCTFAVLLCTVLYYHLGSLEVCTAQFTAVHWSSPGCVSLMLSSVLQSISIDCTESLLWTQLECITVYVISSKLTWLVHCTSTSLHLPAQEVTEGGELETSTRRNLPFFGSVIQSIRRKGSMRNLTVNNVQVQPWGSCFIRLTGTDSVRV